MLHVVVVQWGVNNDNIAVFYTPHDVGEQVGEQGDANDNTVIMPCIAS